MNKFFAVLLPVFMMFNGNFVSFDAKGSEIEGFVENLKSYSSQILNLKETLSMQTKDNTIHNWIKQSNDTSLKKLNKYLVNINKFIMGIAKDPNTYISQNGLSAESPERIALEQAIDNALFGANQKQSYTQSALREIIYQNIH